MKPPPSFKHRERDWKKKAGPADVEREARRPPARTFASWVTGDARPWSRVVHRPIVKKLPGYCGSPVESMRGHAVSVWPAAAGLRSVM